MAKKSSPFSLFFLRLQRLKMPHAEDFGIFKATIMVTLGVIVPLVFAGLLIPYVGIIIILGLAGWIPYLTWLSLIYYYRRKDKPKY